MRGSIFYGKSKQRSGKSFVFLLSLFLVEFFLATPARALSRLEAQTECVNIFYDRGPPGYWMGRTYSVMLQNLMGHFPRFQQIVSPIELYEKGDVEKCRATIYIGSYFENKIPQAFYDDFSTTNKQVAWLGYSIWKVDIEKLFGYAYKGLTTLNKELRDAEGKPTFFKWIDYKGETFFKYGDWSKVDSNIFLAPFEQVRLAETKPGVSQVLATARNNGTDDSLPYAIRARNRFYVTDVPFSYIHEADRYLVMSDILFDILQEPALNEKNALLRLEDVHALSPLADILEISALLKSENIPGNISLIPIFSDPLMIEVHNKAEQYLTMDRKPEFLEVMHELQHGLDYSFIWHGVTHQHGLAIDPYSAVSGDDFEFWDAPNNRAISEDNSRWVLDRLNDGLFTILKSKLPAPMAWLTPHYQASALDYLIFARVFPWNIGRVIYFNFHATGVPDASLHDHYWLKDSSEASQQQRVAAFKELRVEIEPGSSWSGQFFPYEILGDVYGQRLIPEDLGNSQPYTSDHVVRTRTPAEIVAAAKRNLVIRDAWASFFYHPYLLNTFKNSGRGTYPGDSKELAYIVREIKALGYKFINVSEYAATHLQSIRNEPIYREFKK